MRLSVSSCTARYCAGSGRESARVAEERVPRYRRARAPVRGRIFALPVAVEQNRHAAALARLICSWPRPAEVHDRQAAVTLVNSSREWADSRLVDSSTPLNMLSTKCTRKK